MTDKFEERLESRIRDAMERLGIPGLSVGVTRGGQVIYSGGFGVLALGEPASVDVRTVFHMASVTKPFVATAIVQLAEQGKLGLDDRVAEHLPYFRLQDDRAQEITIRQMLTHSSGMPDVEDYEWDKPQYDEGSLERWVRSLKTWPLLGPPGEQVAYSNIAFEVLADVIAKVSGVPFEDYVHSRILRPIGMSESTLLMPQPLPDHWARPHSRGADKRTFAQSVYPYNRRHAASSTLHSNVVEMNRWALANLNRGHLGARILSPQSYDVLWQPQADTGLFGARYGLSWLVSSRLGHRDVSHGGGDVGFSTHVALLPDLGVSAVTMCNLDGAQLVVRGIATAAMALSLGMEPEPVFPTEETLDAIQGTYYSPGREPLYLSVEDGDVVAVTGDERTVLSPIDASRFAGPPGPNGQRIVLVVKEGTPTLSEGPLHWEKVR